MGMNTRKNIRDKIFLFLMYAIVFFMPVYGRLLPLLIGLLFLNWLTTARYLKAVRLIFIEKRRFFLFSFSFLYVFYLAGLVNTSNFHYAGEDLMTKLSILLFPLIFATSDVPISGGRDQWMIIKVFAAGCIAGSLVLLGRALYNSVVLHQAGAFYYTSLSWTFHPGYYAMYLSFAMSNILFFMLIRQSVRGYVQIAGHILILVFLTLMIVLLSSKAGLLLWISVVVFYTGIMMFRYKRWLGATAFAAIAAIVFLVLILAFPKAAGRVSQASKEIRMQYPQGDQGQSTGERLAIWKASEEIIRRNLAFGVGTGDVKDALMEQYKADSLEKVRTLKLNAHNQYLQTLITLGIFGLTLLAGLFVVPGISAFRKEYYIYFAFLFITGISMFFESMLERQAGVVFYALFNALLYSLYPSDPVDDPEDIAVAQV